MARRERRDETETFDPAAEAVTEPHREAVGRQLQRVREELGESLQDVSQELRIRYVYLHAIEQCRYDELPGPTYAVGFVRGYADYLGLPSEEVVRRFKEEMSGLPQGSALQFPVPKPEGRIPGLAILLVSLLLLALVYGGWYLWNEHGQRVVELLPWPAGEQPAQAPEAAGVPQSVPLSETSAPTAAPLLAPLPSPSLPEADPSATAAEPVAAESAAEGGSASPALDRAPGMEAAIGTVPAAGGVQESAPGAETPPSEEPAGAAETAEPTAAGASGDVDEPQPTVIGESPNLAAAISAPTQAETSAAIPEPPPAGTPEALGSGHAYGAVNSDARVRIVATADSWVQVRDANEQPLFTQVLRPGDTYAVPNRAGLTLLTGNAGGLELEVDGTRLPALGPLGAVRRGIALDPERLLAAQPR